ncbi:hypothetical protein KHQ81_02835 [Mycoplasmatota bacterium]|nr:hypothetical protein KHQ81_02835 [Mycoplasmatota bacterium]
MSFFEIGMLICFGFAWPVSIYKSITSKSVSGKSVFFLYVILLGYFFGIVHKIYYDFNSVIYLYIINALMVFIDIILYYRNLHLIKKKELN